MGMTKQVMVIGAGKIGGAIALMLAATGDWQVTVADRSAEQLAKLDKHPAIEGLALDILNHGEVVNALKGRFAVLSAAPFHLTGRIAEAAREAGVHYLDLTEDVATTRMVERLADGRPARSSRNAASRPASSRSSPTISPRASTASIRCACASARCRSIRRTP